jgi:hypothetical protein
MFLGGVVPLSVNLLFELASFSQIFIKYAEPRANPSNQIAAISQIDRALAILRIYRLLIAHGGVLL